MVFFVNPYEPALCTPEVSVVSSFESCHQPFLFHPLLWSTFAFILNASSAAVAPIRNSWPAGPATQATQTYGTCRPQRPSEPSSPPIVFAPSLALVNLTVVFIVMYSSATNASKWIVKRPFPPKKLETQVDTNKFGKTHKKVVVFRIGLFFDCVFHQTFLNFF